MTYQQQMVQAIESAEKWQAEVERYERYAAQEARSIIRSKRHRKDRDKPVEMGPVFVSHTKKVLENDSMYHRAVGNRNAQQTLAQMYGTAALVEQGNPTQEPPWVPPHGLCDDACTDQPHQPHMWTANRTAYYCPGA